MRRIFTYALVATFFWGKTSFTQNVGIGTLTPINKLTVIGDGSFRSTAMSLISNRVFGGGLLVSNTNGNEQTLRIDGSNIQSTYSDPLIFPPSNIPRPFVLNPYGGNIGIGTNFTPEYKLHIWSKDEQLIKIDGKNGLVLFHDNVSNAQYGFFRSWTSSPFNPAEYYGLEIGTPPSYGGDPAKRLMFSTNYNLRLTIMEDGNVGVNTTNPKSKLDVNGSLSLPIRTITTAGSTAITDDDYTIIVDMKNISNNNVNLILPSANNRKGRLYNISGINIPTNDFGATTGIINIFDNGPSVLIKLFSNYLAGFDPYETKSESATLCTLQSDGSTWHVIALNYDRFRDTR